MKIVINNDFGGFDYPNEQFEGCERNDIQFVEWVENHSNECQFDGTSLEVVEIPDEATDFDIIDYDGSESVVYVVDGKIHYAC